MNICGNSMITIQALGNLLVQDCVSSKHCIWAPTWDDGQLIFGQQCNFQPNAAITTMNLQTWPDSLACLGFLTAMILQFEKV